MNIALGHEKDKTIGIVFFVLQGFPFLGSILPRNGERVTIFLIRIAKRNK